MPKHVKLNEHFSVLFEFYCMRFCLFSKTRNNFIKLFQIAFCQIHHNVLFLNFCRMRLIFKLFFKYIYNIYNYSFKLCPPRMFFRSKIASIQRFIRVFIACDFVQFQKREIISSNFFKLPFVGFHHNALFLNFCRMRLILKLFFKYIYNKYNYSFNLVSQGCFFETKLLLFSVLFEFLQHAILIFSKTRNNFFKHFQISFCWISPQAPYS